jgi:endonuclease YncB( thermonuclease family)
MRNTIGSGATPGFGGCLNPRLRHCRTALRNSRSRYSSARGAAGENAVGRVVVFLGFCALGLLALRSPAVLGAGAATATAGAGPTIAGPTIAGPTGEEWLNQKVRLRDTAQAVDRPAADGKPAGEIRAGAEIEAIGLVAGKSWVQIELPNHALAYLPRSAIEFENGGAASSAPAAPRAANPAGATSPPTSAAATPAGAPASVSGAVRGTVSRVPNAATLVVANQRIRLSGIDPGPPAVLAPFEKWVEAQGPLDCAPDAQTGRYRCLTGGGIDVAQAAILNGSGRVGDGASPAYRDSEIQARNAKRGLWGQP